MTVQRFRERELQQRLAELYLQPMPAYRDEVLQQVERTPQRPTWTFPARWLPMFVVTSRVATAPPIRWRTILVLGLLLIALVAGTVLLVGSQRQDLPPPFGPAANGTIVYSWQGDIMARDTLAATPRVLIGEDSKDVAQSYSPDGTRILFFRGGTDEQMGWSTFQELWVAGADGSHPVRIGGPYKDCCWTDWSPTGDRIAVSYYDVTAGHDVIDIVRTDGSGSIRMDPGMPVTNPTFRPVDGSQLLFRGRAVDGKGWALYLANADGSAPRRLAIATDAGYGSDDDFVDAAWSHDGTRLAFAIVDAETSAPGGTGQRIHVADVAPDGTVITERRLTGRVDADHQYGPLWLPDGEAIVYRQWRGAGEEVWEALAEGDSPPRYLGVSAGSGIPTSIAPDGTEVLALDTHSSTLYRIDLASGSVAKQFLADWVANYQRRALP